MNGLAATYSNKHNKVPFILTQRQYTYNFTINSHGHGNSKHCTDNILANILFSNRIYYSCEKFSSKNTYRYFNVSMNFNIPFSIRLDLLDKSIEWTNKKGVVKQLYWVKNVSKTWCLLKKKKKNRHEDVSHVSA